jgi:predicted nucleic acid-binding protein
LEEVSVHEYTKRKFKDKVGVVDMLLSQIPYELVYSPQQPPSRVFEIRDKKDYPVLYSAIAEDVDVFITGDKDFDDVDIEKPEILTATEFLENY